MNYLKVYCSLVNKRLNEPATENFEKHHIIPRSLEDRQIVLDLFKDYEVGQLVHLTYREHYIVHGLLVKIFEKIDKHSYFKMLRAWQRLADDKTHTSWQYAVFRKRWIKDCDSGENHPCKRPEVREKISKNHADVSDKNNPMYGKQHTEEAKRKMSENNPMKRPEIVAKISGENNPTKRPNVKKKISESIKNLWKNEEYRKKQKLRITTIETRKKISINRKGKNSGKNNSNSIPIVQLNLNYELIRQYDYIGQVNEYGFCKNYVNSCINHKYITKLSNNIYGKKDEEHFIWMRLDEYKQMIGGDE